MKRILKISIFIIFILTIIIFNRGIIERELLKISVSNELKDYLNNGKETKYLTEDQMQWLKFAKNKVFNRYDITDFVTYYINMIKDCVKEKSGSSNIRKYSEYKKILLPWEGITIYSADGNSYIDGIKESITEKDIVLYQSGTIKEKAFTKKLVEEFSRFLTFDEVSQLWYIEGNEDKTIELPYGLYIKYEPNKRKERVKPKKVLQVKILNEDLHKLDYKKSMPVQMIVKYINNDDIVEEKKCIFGLKDKERIVLTPNGFSNMYFYEANRAEIVLHSHSYDEELRRRNEKEEERVRISNELEARDPSTVQIDYDIKRIEMFKKYNQYAQIDVVTYKDGSKKSFFRKHTSYVNDEGRKIMRYMKRELPYKDVTIEEAYELYINDKEQYSIDEELLKGNQPLVEYISYEQ